MRVLAAKKLSFACLNEPLIGVQSDRFKQSVAAGIVVELDEGFVDQLQQRFKHCLWKNGDETPRLIASVPSADDLGGL